MGWCFWGGAGGGGGGEGWYEEMLLLVKHVPFLYFFVIPEKIWWQGSPRKMLGRTYKKYIPFNRQNLEEV